MEAIAPTGLPPMHAGERMRLVSAAAGSNAPVTEQIDRQRVEQVMAGTRKQVVLDDASLADAVAEMTATTERQSCWSAMPPSRGCVSAFCFGPVTAPDLRVLWRRSTARSRVSVLDVWNLRPPNRASTG